jgi:hypothetical protein
MNYLVWFYGLSAGIIRPWRILEFFLLFILPFAIIVLIICIYFHVLNKCPISLCAGSKFGLTHISTMADLRQFIDKNPMSLTTLEEANRQPYE